MPYSLVMKTLLIMNKNLSCYAKRAIISLTVCSTIIVPLWGQVKEVRNVPSPEVANLGTFGSIPVGHYTGTPNITVPIYTMKVGNVSIPVQAMYHTSNVKPHTPPSCLGIGWSLYAGGYIARTVKGVQDEKETYSTHAGFYYNHNKLSQIENSTNKSNALEERTHLSGNDFYELSADEFSFNFNGYSGSFFMDKDGQWRVVSDDNIKVEFNEQDGFKTIEDLGQRFSLQLYAVSMNKKFFDKFTLITPDGTRYEFGGGNATEYSVPYYNQVNGDIMATCWRLSKITTVDGRVANFEYAADSYMCNIHYAPQMLEYNTYPVIRIYNKGISGYSGFLTMPSRLLKISCDDDSICFKYNRDNDYGNLFFNNTNCLYWTEPEARYLYGSIEQQFRANRFSLFMGVSPLETVNETRNAIASRITHDYLSEITVKKSITDILSVSFNLTQISNRKLLTKIVFNKNNMTEYSAPFTDDFINPKIGPLGDGVNSFNGGEVIPPDGQYSMVFMEKEYEYRFEYYLDSNVNNMWPDRNPLTYTDSWGYYSRYGSDPNNCGEWQLSRSYTENEYGIRPASLVPTRYYVLKNIIYPTGGRTLFEYELNDYSKEFDLQTDTVMAKTGVSGGLRVKTLKNYDVSGILLYSKNYIYKNALNGISSGISKGEPCFYDRIYFKENKSEYIDFYSFEDMNPYPMNFNTPYVGYSTVFEELRDSDNNVITRTKYQYTNYDTDANDMSHMDEPADYTANVYDTYASAAFTSMAFERGKLASREVMDADNNILEKTTFYYGRTVGDPCSTVSQEWHLDCFNNMFGFSYLYKTYVNRYLVSTEERQETMGNGTYNTEIRYQYTDYGMPRKKTVISNSDETHQTTYYYSTERYPWMAEKNIIVPVETEEKENNWYCSTVRNYAQSSLGVPFVERQVTWWDSSNTSVPHKRAHKDYVVERADQYGNPIIWREQGARTIMIWSHKGRKLVATVQNATYDEVQNALGRAPEELSGLSQPDNSLDSLRTRLGKAYVWRYKYDNMLNLTEKTEPGGMSCRYEYDMLGRLVAEYRKVNGKWELLNSYKYNYSTK